MKKNICFFLIGLMTAFSISAYAGSSIKEAKISENTKLVVLGKEVNTDIVYAIKEGDEYGRNYVSAADLAQALGYDVIWDNNKKIINISNKNPIKYEEGQELISAIKQLLEIKEGEYEKLSKRLLEVQENTGWSSTDVSLYVFADFFLWISDSEEDAVFESLWNSIFSDENNSSPKLHEFNVPDLDN